MKTLPTGLQFIVNHPLRFLLQVFRGFRDNQGFLLSAAVAYYTLLSIIPMLALIGIVLSQVIAPQVILELTQKYLTLLLPGKTDVLVAQMAWFLSNWKLMGITGVVFLLISSALAISTLERAMAAIFHHRPLTRRRFVISILLPYAYILAIALGLFAVSFISSGLYALSKQSIHIFGKTWSFGHYPGILIYTLGIAGQIVLLSSLYLVIPTGRVPWRHALVGGAAATLFWEIARHILLWYFSTLSLASVVYGAFSTAIVILLSIDVAAIILLLGAQVIADYERLEHTSGRQSSDQNAGSIT